jgi:hypothetical protein
MVRRTVLQIEAVKQLFLHRKQPGLLQPYSSNADTVSAAD